MTQRIQTITPLVKPSVVVRASEAARGSARRSGSRTRTNLIVDIIIFVGFMLSTAPAFTGMAIHEWLGLALAAGIVTHLLLHWQWLVEVTRRFFRRMPWGTRINYVLNSLLFVSIVLISASGIMISKEALPLLGLEVSGGGSWKMIHTLSADAIVFLMGLHVALHWSWIVDAVKRYLLSPLARMGKRDLRTPELATAAGQQAVNSNGSVN